MVAAAAGRRNEQQPSAHQEGHIRHPRVEGTWSSHLPCLLSPTTIYVYMTEETNFPTKSAQCKYTLIAIRCSSSLSCRNLIAGYDIGTVFKGTSASWRPIKFTTDKQPSVIYCIEISPYQRSPLFDRIVHSAFGAVCISAVTLHGCRIDWRFSSFVMAFLPFQPEN